MCTSTVRSPTTTSLRPASAGLPEVRSLNSRHEPIELDETALLACANNQIAFVSLQRSDTATATRELVAASLRAKDSDVGDVSAASNGLMVAATSADPSPTVLAFLGLCTDHGFEY